MSIRAADLASTAVSNPPATARLGASLQVSDSTANRGNAASVASVTRYYLSLDTGKDAADRLLTGSRSTGILAAGASSSGSLNVSIPAGTPAGVYYLLACADDTSFINESSEANNCLASSSTLQIP